MIPRRRKPGRPLSGSPRQLDGNSIAGQLYEWFAREMITATGASAHCGTIAQIAELHVYFKAPVTVLRRPGCGHVVIVLADIQRALRITLDHFELLEPTEPPPPGVVEPRRR